MLDRTIPLDIDEDELTRLVRLYDADLIRFCFLLSGDLELARDAVQNTWERVWTKPPRLRDDRKLRAWLLTVSANEARQMVRRRIRGAALAQTAFEAVSYESTPPEILDLRSVVRALSHDERVLLALRYGLELDAAEIGDILHLSPEGVRSRLFRLIRRLRSMIDGV